MNRDLSNVIVRPELLLTANRALRGTHISLADYSAIDASEGDFVYLDPPYDGAEVNGYGGLGFAKADQYRLRDFCFELDSRGVKFLQSNADTAFMRELYSGEPFRIHNVRSWQTIAEKTLRMTELLITNYAPSAPVARREVL